MQTRAQFLVLWAVVCCICAVIESTVAVPIVTIGLVTTQFGRGISWMHALLLALVSLVLSSIYLVAWYSIFAVLLVIPILAVVRARAAGTGSMPLPLVLSISSICVVLLAVFAGIRPTMGMVLYTVAFSIIGYGSLFFLRSRQQKRRLVEWFWISS